MSVIVQNSTNATYGDTTLTCVLQLQREVLFSIIFVSSNVSTKHMITKDQFCQYTRWNKNNTLAETCFCQTSWPFKLRFKPMLAETCQPCLKANTMYHKTIFQQFKLYVQRTKPSPANPLDRTLYQSYVNTCRRTNHPNTTDGHKQQFAVCCRNIYKKLSCRRQAVSCFVSLNILLKSL